MMDDDPRVIDLEKRKEAIQAEIAERKRELVKIEGELDTLAKAYAKFKVGDKFFDISRRVWFIVKSVEWRKAGVIGYYGWIAKADKNTVPSERDATFSGYLTERDIEQGIKDKTILMYKEGMDTSDFFAATKKKVVKVVRLKKPEESVTRFFLEFSHGDGVIVDIGGYSEHTLKLLENGTSYDLINRKTTYGFRYVLMVRANPSDDPYRRRLRIEIRRIVKYVPSDKNQKNITLLTEVF